MRVVAIIIALAAGASGVPGPCDSAEFECKEDPYCMWLETCVDRRRNLRFGAAAPGCCVGVCSGARRLTAEEMAALSAEQREARRRLGCGTGH
jgi:hypothetical protein